MIVVEGPDGAGKSTLVKWICENFDLEEGPRSTTNRDEIYKTTRQDTWWAMSDELKLKRSSWVWDRMGPISDPIYSSVSTPSRKCAFTKPEIRVFQKFMDELGLLIMCLPPLDTVIENCSKHHQMKGVREKIKEIYRQYQDLAYHGHAQVIYNYEHQPVAVSAGVAVSQYLRRRNDRQCLSSSTPATCKSDPNLKEA